MNYRFERMEHMNLSTCLPNGAASHDCVANQKVIRYSRVMAYIDPIHIHQFPYKDSIEWIATSVQHLYLYEASLDPPTYIHIYHARPYLPI